MRPTPTSPSRRSSAARLGVLAGNEPPPAEAGDGLELVSTDVHSPADLAHALDALEADEPLVDARRS